ncbi:MAG: bifunctional oligoribonuclease/PAP phosphatase NrnA [Tepidanaerobacteraceae bacterium]|jgi:phosphoesterase RecJ-like protein|nr:bifunctional oligoribonuclease/PAP phosphatase NrnA [Tepidanaerobacteraceae bacterium]
MDFSAFYNILAKYNSYIVTSHIVPDGDGIGSVLAMMLALQKAGKNAVAVVRDTVPDKYIFLPYARTIKKDFDGKYDVIISLDCGDEERLGFEKPLKDLGKIVVNIDHHKSNTFFGDINIIDCHASSVGEILYHIIKDLTIIDMDIATNIYTSIITDTGSLRYSNTTPSCLRILAELVEKGVKPDFISRQVFEKRSIESVNLIKMALNTLEILSDGMLACIFITKEIMEKSGAKEEDTDGIINYAREIEGVEVAVLFKEKEEGLIKVGFRSNDWIDVSKIAEEFGGGGHARAAGCTLKATLNETRENVLNSVKKYLAREKS